MKVLLDTHTFLSLMVDDPNLSPRATTTFRDSDNTLYLSMASAWEMAIKSSLNKLKLPVPVDPLYLRIGAAFYVLSKVLVEHPFGVALGLDVIFVKGVETKKLFNGVGEITLYFGILSISFWLGILVWCFVAFAQRNWQKVLLLTYVITCTMISGSWFQLQFNILLVLLLVIM